MLCFTRFHHIWALKHWTPSLMIWVKKKTTQDVQYVFNYLHTGKVKMQNWNG